MTSPQGINTEIPYVRVDPAVTVTYSAAVLGDAPVLAYDNDVDREAWAAETTVVCTSRPQARPRSPTCGSSAAGVAGSRTSVPARGG